MLKGIVFDIMPAVVESPSAQELFRALEFSGIDYTFSFTNPLENCLIITDSAVGIRAAHNAGIPCIGYAPPKSTENMSGAYALFEDFASIDVAYLCRTHAHALGYPAEILSTERLLIREFSEEDFPTLYSMCTEPSTASFMEENLSDYATEQEKHTAYLRSVYPFFDLALWGIFEKVSGKLIGRAGFSLPDDNSDTFTLGYLIDVPYRRRGYAKELIPALLSYAKEQGYPDISARVKPENIGSVKVLEQCGFPYEQRKDTAKGTFIYHIHLNV